MISPDVDELTTRFPDEIRMLLGMLRMSNVGGLAIAECSDFKLRARLIDYFRRRLEADGIYVFNFEVGPNDTNLARSLTELTEHSRFKNLELTGKYKSIVIFVYGIEKFTDAQRDQFVTLLNFLRDRLKAIIQPIVIWSDAAFVSQLSRKAPDFWSWKGHFFRFPSTSSANGTGNGEMTDSQVSPLNRYLQRVIADSDYAIWKELYLPLKANRANEAISPFPPRHTLTKAELRQLAPLFPHAESYKDNETIFRKGDRGDKSYIIVGGEVEVLVPDALGNEMVVSRLGRGDFFGEVALIKRVPRTATIRTTKPSKFVTLTHRSLNLISQRAPGVLEILTDIAQRRLEARSRDDKDGVNPLRLFGIEGSNLIREAPVDVRDLIAHDQRAVILGDAGGGKTTVLRRLMLDTAEQSLHQMNSSNDPIVLPIFIKLNTLSPDKTMEEVILDILRSYEIYEFESEADVTALLKGQNQAYGPLHSVLFLMDGLNEMPFQDKTGVELNRFIHEYGQHRFLLTCRVQDYTPLYNFRTAMLQRLRGEDIETFLVNYLSAEQGRRVAREIYSDPQLEDLAQSPLALYMFTQIARDSQESLPKNRGILFEAFTENLLERTDSEWWQNFGYSQAKVPLALRKSALADLGLAMQEQEAWAYPFEQWIDIISRALYLYTEEAGPGERVELQHVTAEDIHEEIKHSGLIRYAATKEWVEFAHHTYQEFFAALAQREQGYDIEPNLQDTETRRRWQGTIILLYGITKDNAELYSKILGENNDYARIWLGAQCIANSGEEITAALQRLERQLPLDQYFALLFSVGLAARQTGRYAEALSYLDLAAEQDPTSAEVQYELGTLFRHVKQYAQAEQKLELAIRFRSDFVDAYNQLGVTYYDQGKYIEALTVFKATTQLEPANAHHFYNLGTTQKILRDYVSARESFRTALKLRPDYSEARTQLDILDKALATGVVRVLENIPILSEISLEQSVLLANRLKVEEYKPGQIVFHMGASGDKFYIIEAGEVEVLAPDIGSQRGSVINRLSVGDFFGEIALLRSVPRTATIRAVKSTRLLAISREDFDLVRENYPSIAHSVAETSSYRLLRDRQIGRRDNLDRYYDPGYIAELTHQDEVTVLMGDIHGSTYLTNTIGPELMVAYLDEYLLRMSTLIVQAGGAMDKSLGDSVMGVFGNFPARHSDDRVTSAHSAIFAAIKMRQEYLTLREEWTKKHPAFGQSGMGIGISTGKVKTGTVGSEATMVGPAVNMSSKLSKMAVNGRTESEIYIDANTLGLAGDAFRTEQLDPAYTKKKVGVELEAHRVIRRK